MREALTEPAYEATQAVRTLTMPSRRRRCDPEPTPTPTPTPTPPARGGVRAGPASPAGEKRPVWAWVLVGALVVGLVIAAIVALPGTTGGPKPVGARADRHHHAADAAGHARRRCPRASVRRSRSSPPIRPSTARRVHGLKQLRVPGQARRQEGRRPRPPDQRGVADGGSTAFGATVVRLLGSATAATSPVTGADGRSGKGEGEVAEGQGS
jgi:hypothetical protein